MDKDMVFDKILMELTTVHKEHPDLKFGFVIQAAIDFSKRKHNVDLTDYSSKDFLRCLHEFHRTTTLKRKGKFIKQEDKEFKSKLLKINGIGEKTTKDIISVYDTENSLMYGLKNKLPMPFRDDVVELLDKNFKEV